jgi:short-subunit dehydrogenase
MSRLQKYFKNKTCVVTGGASGIGWALVQQLIDYGAQVTYLDLHQTTRPFKTRAENSVKFIRCDLEDEKEINLAFDSINTQAHGIDLWINNAGIGFTGEFNDLALNDWSKVISLNLTGLFICSHLAYKQMVKQQHGQIINISSMAGLITFPLGAPYAASKFGAYALSRVMRMEGSVYGIKVNTACPGYVESNLLQNSKLLGVEKNFFVKQIPFKAISSDRAASIILNGARKNKAVIVFPRYAYFLWLLCRFIPTAMDKAMSMNVNKFKQMKLDHPGRNDDAS